MERSVENKTSECMGWENSFCGDEEKYRIHFSLADDVIYSIDTHFRITSVSPNIKRILGYEPEELIGRIFHELHVIDPGDLEKAISDTSILLAGEKISSTCRFITKDGKVKFGEIKGEPFIKDGHVIGLIAVARDITERKFAEDSFHESEEKYRQLAETAHDIIVSVDLNFKITYVNNATLNFFGDNLVGMSLLNFTPPQLHHLQEEMMQQRREGFSDMLAFEWEVIHPTGKIATFDIRASLLAKDGKPSGVMFVARDMTERKKIEQALKESEERYRLLAENARDVIWMRDLNMKCLYISPSVIRLRGFSVEEAMKQSIEDMLTPESFRKAMLIFEQERISERTGKKHSSDWSITIELELLCSDGSCIMTENTVNLLYNQDNKIVGLMGITRDISQRKKAEEELKKSEKRYRLIAENARDVIWIRDINFNCLYTSPSTKYLRGFTEEETSGLGFEDILTPESLEKAMLAFERERQFVLGGNKHDPNWSATIELEVICRDGSHIFTENKISLLYDQDQKITGLLGITRDITERKRIEEALKESEKRYRLLAENARDVIWVINEELKYLYVSPSIVKLRGYTAEEAMQISLDKTLAPESYKVALSLFYEGLELEKSGKKHGPDWSKNLELELICKDGSTVWTDVMVSIIYDEGGNATALQGITRDISERKKAEQALKASEERFKQVAENAGEWIWEVDAVGIYRYSSPVVENLLGYSVDELVGRLHFYDLFAPEAREDLKAQALAAFRRRDPFHKFINPNMHKNGNIVILETSGTPLFDEKGNLIGYRGTDMDITERVRVEEELKKYRQHLEELVKERTAELLKANGFLQQEIEVREKSESALRSRELELEERQRSLEEMNITMKVLLKQRNDDKDEIEKNLVANINTSLQLYLDKLRNSDLNDDQMRYVAEIETHLKKINSSFIRDISSEYLGLSPSEIRVASLVKEGKSSKEIADLLNISLNTVLFHRNNIRDKVGLKNNRVNLITYLQGFDNKRN
jgi:PAS domain S-box-containing protein